jgi:uncharacterized protein (TIGR02118 family)
MPTRVLALYGHPTDPSAFDDYYVSTHAPLAKKLPGLRSYTVSTGADRSTSRMALPMRDTEWGAPI